jgi:hypothetical protein
MRTRPNLRSTAGLALLALLGACSTPRLEVMPRVQEAKLGGTIGAGTTGMTIPNNDIDSDLGLGQSSSEFGGRADLSFAAGTWTFAYAPASFSGSGTLNADITNGGVTIPAGTAVDSNVKMDIGSVLWTHDFIPGDNFELGLGLGAHLLDFKGTITDGTNTLSFDQSAPVPVLALRGGAAFGAFDVSALLSGMQFKSGSDDATFFDADVMGRWRFLGGVEGHLSAALVVGWRKTDVKLDYTDGADHVNADLNVSGIYYGLSVGF